MQHVEEHTQSEEAQPPPCSEHFRARFVDVPAILKDWITPHAPIAGADILDFACGEGVTALGVALSLNPRRVVGVDIMPDPERCLSVARTNLGLNELPGSMSLHRVSPGHLHEPGDRFDIAYSWSVFEHVDQRLIERSLELIRASLRPGGVFLLQVAPLYYSAHGSHLTHRIAEPWVHLRSQQNVLYERLAAASSGDAELRHLWSTYETLNRLTAKDLLNHVRSAGFEIIRVHTTRDAEELPRGLDDIFNHEILTMNQLVILARPNESMSTSEGGIR